MCYNTLMKRDLYKKLGSQLIERGQWFLKTAFNVKVVRTISSSQIRTFFKGLGYDKLQFADRLYSIIDWKTMKDIIKYSWVNRKKYVSEKFDCDDYALAFKGHVSEIYNINSVALAKHIKVTTSSGKEIWHRACVVLAVEDNILKAFLLETQNDKFIEITDSKLLMLGKWRYSLDTIEL